MGFKTIPIITKFEAELSLKPGFFSKLVEEDDWTFIIKLSALFEAACTQLLVTTLNARELSRAFSHLDLGNIKYGKLEMLDSLGVLGDKCRNYISSLAAIRNDFVHDVSKTSATILEHVATMKNKTQVIITGSTK